MPESLNGEWQEPKLPPKVAIYRRVTKAKETLEQEVYDRAAREFSAQHAELDFNVVIEHATIAREDLQLYFDKNGPKIDLEGRPVVIDEIISNLSGEQDLIEVYLTRSPGAKSSIPKSLKKVVLAPEMPPMLVVINTHFMHVNNLHNPEFTARGALETVKALDPSAKRELTDEECEMIANALESYTVPDDMVSYAQEYIYQSYISDRLQ